MAEAGLTERLQGRAERAGLPLAPALAARLAAYVALLLRWNEHMNLTALRADDQGLDRLVVEPLLAERRIPRGAAALVDIGSGGGSPAIPIRIARPRLVVRLVEARERKAAFLREAVRQLKLDGVVVEPCRYEELLDRAELQGAHDVLTVRGVRLDAGAASCLERLVRAGGTLLFFGGAGGRETGGSAGRAGAGLGKGAGLVEGSGLVVVRKGGP
ncbi:MAG: 16S rRNA (guanine(527)-N(7))-methyltransferase RsmG [Acidobacteria bacterium]|nr:16S rRNA (guanine(527)-N(7))-methyltransferase RsmG [Acidobacteriota bacterium]